MTALAACRVEVATASAGWSPADLVHALSQLPDGVSLTLECKSTERATVDLLSRAYGVDRRLQVHETHGDVQWRFDGIARTPPAPASNMAQLVDSVWPPGVDSAVPAGDDTVLRGHSIALVNKNPSHYRMPLFNGLAERTARAGASLRVFFLGQNPASQPWLTSEEAPHFDHEFLATAEVPSWVPISGRLDRRRAPTRIPKAVGRRLRAFGPSIVLSGSFSFAGIAAQTYASRHGLPFGLWNGEIAAQSVKRSYPTLRARQRRWLARRADFGVAYGSAATSYLLDLAPTLPVVFSRNTSVTDIPAHGDRDGNELLEIVTVADLSVPGKGIEIVVEALQHIRSGPCRMRVVGTPPADGPLARAASRDPRVEFLGPLPHDDVIAVLQSSDVFVFPSQVDIFGLALVEAMAAGLPTITSSIPGAVADLVRPGENGLVADDDPRSWADAIEALMDSASLRASVGAEAQATIRRRWTMRHAVEGMMASFRLGALVAERRS